MNNLGFFVCWVVIGIFVRFTRWFVIGLWVEQKFDKKHQDAIDDYINDVSSDLNDFMNMSKSNMRFVVSILAFCTTIEIIAWPIALIGEFMLRLKVAKETDEKES